MPPRLAIVESHPIQYKAPLFRRLAADPRLDMTVYYATIPDAAVQGDGFGVAFQWDVPLLDGYRYQVLRNRARHPSVTRFGGCDTPEMYRRLRDDRPDAVLVNGWVVKTCLQALWACRRLGIPCLVRGEANLLRPRAAWKRALHRLLLRQYRGYLAIGAANRAFYRFHGCPEDRIFFAPYAVDNDRFAAAAAERRGRRGELRAAFNLPADAVVFLFCGKLEAKKRPMDALRALETAPAASAAGSSAAALLVVGDGPLRADCERFARDRKLPAVFAGFLNQSRLPDAYAAADVLVLPSDAGETWGLVVNEAMASGRPAIVSRAAGCCEDLVVEGETGFAFDCGDAPALAERMGRYLADPALAGRQGGAASRRIERFDLSAAAEGIAQAVCATVQCRRSGRENGPRGEPGANPR